MGKWTFFRVNAAFSCNVRTYYNMVRRTRLKLRYKYIAYLVYFVVNKCTKWYLNVEHVMLFEVLSYWLCSKLRKIAWLFPILSHINVKIIDSHLHIVPMGYKYLRDTTLVYFWFRTQQCMLSTIDVMFVLFLYIKAKQRSQFTHNVTLRAPVVIFEVLHLCQGKVRWICVGINAVHYLVTCILIVHVEFYCMWDKPL
jgi:hypothetical protein